MTALGHNKLNGVKGNAIVRKNVRQPQVSEFQIPGTHLDNGCSLVTNLKSCFALIQIVITLTHWCLEMVVILQIASHVFCGEKYLYFD